MPASSPAAPPTPLAAKVKLADLKDNSDGSRLGVLTDKDRQRLEKYEIATRFLLASQA